MVGGESRPGRVQTGADNPTEQVLLFVPESV
jgi:hypothetical protein